MTDEKCPRCGMPREDEHQFCPSCGYNYAKAVRTATAEAKPAKANHRRDLMILALVIIATAVIYNVVSAIVNRDKPVVSAVNNTAAAPVLHDVILAGNKAMDAKKFDQAIPQYEQALALDSLQPDIMVDLGACYHAVGDNDKAGREFRRALAIQPRHQVALFNLGVVSLTEGDTASARTWWTKYLEVGTDTVQIRTVRDELSRM